MWTVEDEPPVDPEARELAVTLAAGGPRWVSPDGEFAIWSASLENGRAAHAARRVSATSPPGESIVVAGAVERHARYGWQFSVESFRSALPQTAEGVALWLRRRVPGIGPTFARAIVEHFGAEHVFAELDRDPERLREVRTKAGRAISRRAMERAVEAWREVAADPRGRDVPLLARDRRRPRRAARPHVRDDVIAVLEDDPYRLTEVPRIGFRVADRVARSLGIELDAPQRLRAGLLFVLAEAAGNGNVFLPLPELWQAAARLLEVHDAEPLEAALARLAREDEVVVERERVYLAELVGGRDAPRCCARASARRRRTTSCSTLRAGPSGSRCRTSSGRSSSSSARGRSFCSPGFRAPARRTRSASSSSWPAAPASASSSARRRARRRAGCAT